MNVCRFRAVKAFTPLLALVFLLSAAARVGADQKNPTRREASDKNCLTRIEKDFGSCHCYTYFRITGREVKRRLLAAGHKTLEKKARELGFFDLLQGKSLTFGEVIAGGLLKDGDVVVIGQAHSGIVGKMGRIEGAFWHYLGWTEFDGRGTPTGKSSDAKPPGVKRNQLPHAIYCHRPRDLATLGPPKAQYGTIRPTKLFRLGWVGRWRTLRATIKGVDDKGKPFEFVVPAKSNTLFDIHVSDLTSGKVKLAMRKSKSSKEELMLTVDLRKPYVGAAVWGKGAVNSGAFPPALKKISPSVKLVGAAGGRRPTKLLLVLESLDPKEPGSWHFEFGRVPD